MPLKLLLTLILSVIIPTTANAISASPEVQKAIKAIKKGDLKRAVQLLDTSCRSGNQESCALLGESYLFGWGTKKDFDMAYKLLSESCSKGIALGCNGIGLMYRDGLKVEKSFSKAMEFFKKACDLNSFGQGIGCGNYGNMYLYGWGVTPNFRKAIILFLKSCNLGAGIGCNNAGIMYEKGFGVEKNLEKAIEFFTKACHTDDGKITGCYNLGRLLYRVKKDEKEAVNYLTLSCNLGYQPACDVLKKISLAKDRPSPFGLTVGITSEDEFKEIVKAKGWRIEGSGYRIIKNDIVNPDVTGYKVTGLPLEKLNSAYFWFFKGTLMEIEYRLHESMDKSTFYMYYDLLKNKYGNPSSYTKPELANGRALWKVGGVEIELYCPWVGGTTYLFYTDPDLYSKAAESDKAVYEEQTKEKAKSLEGI